MENKIARGQITITDLNDGYDGADGVQPNIFGYGTKVYCLSNSHQVFRTKDGLALGIYEYEMENWREVLVFEKVFVEDGFYSVSFEVKTNVTTSRPQRLGLLLGTNDVDGIIQTEVTSDWSKIEIKLYHKYDEEVDELLRSGFAAIIFDEIGGAYSEEGYPEMITIRNLKIERSDNINGLSTPFVGLADDDIPQMGNLLRDTLSFSDETIWSAYNGNITEGLNGCKSFSLQNSNALKEMLKQDITSVLKPNTFYTLSFYAKCSGECTLSVKPYVSGQTLDGDITWQGIRCVNGEAVIGDVDNNYRILESEEWRKHVITFKTRETLSGTKYAIWTVSAQASLSIAMPKLEECEKATAWQQNEADRKGDDAVTYQIDILKAEFTHGGVYNFAKIQARAYKIIGNERQELTTNGSPCLKIDDGDDSYSFDYSEEKGCYEIEEEIGKDVKSLSVFISPNSPAPLSSALYSVFVPVIFDGRVGAIARPCGQWSASATYVWDDNFRDIVIYKDDYYAVKREGLTLSGVIPTNTNNWEKASNFRFVATDLLLSQLAYINNLGVKNLLVYDSNGAIKGGMTATNAAPDGSSLGLGDVRFWLGGNNPQTAPARVYENGAVYFNSGTFEGIIKAKRFAYTTSTNVMRTHFEIDPNAGICNFVVNTGVTVTLPTPKTDIEGLQVIIAVNVYVSTYSRVTITTPNENMKIYYDTTATRTIKLASGSVTLCIIAQSWRVISAASSNITTS